MFERVVKHIAAFRSRPSVRLLNVLYGPRALSLRTQVAALILDRKVTGSDPEAQYGRLRKRLLILAGVYPPSCIATEDAEFERRATEVL